MGSQRPLTLAKVPTSTHLRLIEITKNRIDEARARLPGINSYEVNKYERKVWLDDKLDAVDKYIPPLDLAPGGSTWLAVSAVDSPSLHACAHLAELVCERLGSNDLLNAHKSSVAQQSEALDEITGRGHLAQALEEVLVQGFKQGADAIFDVHLYLPRQMQSWLSPVIEFSGKPGRLDDVHICWIPIKPMHLEPAPPREKLTITNRKKHARSRRTRRSGTTRRSIKKSKRSRAQTQFVTG